MFTNWKFSLSFQEKIFVKTIFIYKYQSRKTFFVTFFILCFPDFHGMWPAARVPLRQIRVLAACMIPSLEESHVDIGIL